MGIADLLRSHGLRPKKSFGQNFLVDVHACESIAAAAAEPAGGTVLELGAGLGALTRPLLARASRVVAVERDRDLVPILRTELAEPLERGALEILEADAARLDWLAAFAGGPRPHAVAGNLPYLITGRLLERATEIADSIDRCVFMVQAEVADRLVAAPDTEAYGALSVFVQAAFSVKRVLSVRAGAFFPRPEVDSAVVLFVPHRPRLAEETPAFREAVKAAFGGRRKTLRNAWKGLYGWSREELDRHAAEAGIDLGLRGETLGVDAFARLARAAPKRGAVSSAEPGRLTRDKPTRD
jgi:16S rRNA (adenine1518-N6/adenine1519-N6)-dimethyltransferase